MFCTRDKRLKNELEMHHLVATASLDISTMCVFVLQLSSSHHIKDGEGRSKKLSSHGHSHRSKKTGGAGKSCSSSSCSSSPFNTGADQPANQMLLSCIIPGDQTQIHKWAKM